MAGKSKAAKKDPRAIAERAVEQFFRGISESPDAFAGGSLDTELDNAFGEVAEAIAAASGKDLDKGPGPSDEATAWEIIGRETGYVIGVQVGMRLRGGPVMVVQFPAALRTGRRSDGKESAAGARSYSNLFPARTRVN